MLHPQHDFSKPPFLLSAALVNVDSILPFAAVVPSVRFGLTALAAAAFAAAVSNVTDGIFASLLHRSLDVRFREAGKP